MKTHSRRAFFLSRHCKHDFLKTGTLRSYGNDAILTITLNVPSNVSMTRAPKPFKDDNIPLANGNAGCLASKLHKTQICKAIRLSIEMLVL